MIRIAGYVRVSSREQAIFGYSLDEQQRKISEYVEVYYEKGKFVYTLYREEGESAKTLKRPKIIEIMSLIENSQLDVLIINNLDRLTRNVVDMQVLLELFEAHSIELVSLKEKIDTKSVQGRFFISMIALIAQWEKDTIADRAMRGKYESARQGNYSKGKIPFGYEMNREKGKKLVIKERDAATVRRIFNSIAGGTHTPYTLAEELRAEDPEGKKWRDHHVLEVVQNPIYYGPFKMNDVIVENHTTPIISKETWKKANENATGFIMRRFKYLFKDKIRCSDCDELCQQTCTIKKSGRVYLYYYCPGCRRHINESKIHESLEKTLNTIAITHNMDKHLGALLRKQKYTEQEIRSLIRAYSSGRVKKEYYNEMLDIYLEEKKVILEKITEKKEEINAIKFKDLSCAEKEELITNYIAYISVDPQTYKSKAVMTETYERIAKYGC